MRVMKRILLIDDEDTIQTVVKFGVQMMSGWQVLTASSGEQGIQTAQTEQPDVILLDVMLPDMHGTAALQTLQAHPATQQIPVIFLTARAQPADQQQLQALGARGVITKPFNALDLPERIATMLNWSEQP